jgi:hypothetical protein
LKKLAVVGVIVISIAGMCCANAQQIPDAPIPGASATANGKRNIFERWADFYKEDWKGTAAVGPAAPRRGLPSPLNSPPFPNADWSYGGSPTIGDGRWKCLSAADRDRRSEGEDQGLRLDRADGKRVDVAQQELSGDERHLFEPRRAGPGSRVCRAASGFGAARPYGLGISSHRLLWNRLPVDDEQGLLQQPVAGARSTPTSTFRT